MTLPDAVQVLWSVDSSLPYDGRAAEHYLWDLCRWLPWVACDLRVAGDVGALALLRDGKDSAARTALQNAAHWQEDYASAFTEAYRTLRPDWFDEAERKRREEEERLRREEELRAEAERKRREEEERLRREAAIVNPVSKGAGAKKKPNV